jgi:hypothetical protein
MSKQASAPLEWNLERLVTLGCLEAGKSSIVFYPVDTGDPNPEASEFHETTHQELARNTSHGMFAHLVAIAAEVTRSGALQALVSKAIDRCSLTQEGVATAAEYLFVKEHFPEEARTFVSKLPPYYNMAAASLIRSLDRILPGQPLEVGYGFCVALGTLCMHTEILPHFRNTASLKPADVENFFSKETNVPDVRFALLTRSIENCADKFAKALAPIISTLPVPARVKDNDLSHNMECAFEYISAFLHVFSKCMSIPGVTWEDRSRFAEDAELCFNSWISPHVLSDKHVSRMRMRAWVHERQWHGEWPIVVGMTPSAEMPKKVMCLEVSEVRTMPKILDGLLVNRGSLIYGNLTIPRDGSKVTMKHDANYIIKSGDGYVRLEYVRVNLAKDGSFAGAVTHCVPCLAARGNSGEILQFAREHGNRVDTWVIQDYTDVSIYTRGGPLSEEALRSGGNWLFIRHDRASAETLWELLESWTTHEGWTWQFLTHRSRPHMTYLVLWHPKCRTTHVVPIGPLSLPGVEWIVKRFPGSLNLAPKPIQALCPAWSSRVWMVTDHNNELGF